MVGLGTWITFNVGNDPVARDACAEVMRAFFAAGGRMIDSSPMYGSSQDVIGHGLRKLRHPDALFSADKVWISSRARGPAQIETSRARWGVPRFDLLQVHNLLSWEEHLPALLRMKAEGRVRYVGITTSEGRRHRDIERIMAKEPIDFVQVTYNVLDREVEARILPLARERGIGVIVNRPFREGALIRHVARHRLPAWAAEIGCTSWAQFLLKFVIAHPDVTCAIPGDRQCRACAGEHGRRARHPARRGDARAHGGPRRGAVMSEWWTYRLSDFLMFSPRTYHRLFELTNAEVWPLQIVTIAAGLAALWLAILGSTSRGAHGRVVAAVLAAAWIVVAWAYHLGALRDHQHRRAVLRGGVRGRRRCCWPGARCPARRPSFRSAACAGPVDRLGLVRRRRRALSAAGPVAGPPLDAGRDLRHRARSDCGCDHRRASAGERPHRFASRAAAAVVRDHRAHAVDDGSA